MTNGELLLTEMVAGTATVDAFYDALLNSAFYEKGGIQKAVEIALPLAQLRAAPLEADAKSTDSKASAGARFEIESYQEYQPCNDRLETLLAAVPETVDPSSSKVAFNMAKWIVGKTIESGRDATVDIVEGTILEAQRDRIKAARRAAPSISPK
jgi:hypothetical protein